MGQESARNSGPATIGRYQILRELGRGAMGVVYEAHDPALSRDVALKVIQPFADQAKREEFEQRFLKEARIAARLSHPGIVVVHDVGRDPETGTLFIALERLRGRTLAEIAGSGEPLDWREALRLTAAVARALDHAHAQGVVHRDMKPANVMVLGTGETKIMDFGIASLETARMQLTSPGDFLGTPLYMAPEQALTESADKRADIFSLGGVAYTLLTGRAPFEAPSLPGVVARVVKDDPPAPSSLVPGIPPEVDRVVARAMAKSPDDRHPDAGSLAEELEAILASRGAGQGGVELVLLEEDPLAGLVSDSGPGAAPSSAAAPQAGARRRAAPLPADGGEGHSLASRFGVPVLLLLALGAALGIAWWRETRDAALEPAPSPSAVASPPSAPAPVASPPAADSPPAPVPTPPAAPPPGQLAIDFEHPLESGVLRIWVDDDLVLEEKLASRVSKRALIFKLRKGSVSDVFEVEPGWHQVRVRVQWDDNTKEEKILGRFRSDATRRLEVRVGRLRKNLSLEWK